MKRLLLLVCMVSLIIIPTLASSWGVSPARQLADFTDSSQELSITLKNQDFEEGYFKVTFGGELAQYAEYESTQLVHLSPEIGSKNIPFTLDLPQRLSPGKHTLTVILQQQPPDQDTTTVSSVLSLSASVIVNVPYTGSYVDSQLTIPRADGTSVPMTVSLVNKGETDVSVSLDVTVKSPTNTVLKTWSTDSTILKTLEANKIVTTWNDKGIQPGSYIAEVVVQYDDKTTKLTSPFVVGSKEVTVNGISATDFSLGDINKITLSATNQWNEPVRNIHSTIYVENEDGNVVQQFKSNPVDFKAFETNDYTAYWDTTNLVVGDYVLHTVTITDTQQSEDRFPVVVSADKLTVSLAGQVTGNDQDDKSFIEQNMSLLLLLIVAVVIINIFILFYLKRLKK